jgi:hypothetical protein
MTQLMKLRVKELLQSGAATPDRTLASGSAKLRSSASSQHVQDTRTSIEVAPAHLTSLFSGAMERWSPEVIFYDPFSTDPEELEEGRLSPKPDSKRMPKSYGRPSHLARLKAIEAVSKDLEILGKNRST